MLVAVAGVLLIYPAYAGEMTLSVEAECGERRLTFDPAVIGEGKLREALRLDALTSEGLASQDIPMLELCVTGDKRYRDCGTRRLGAPFFFENARVNLAQGAKRLERMKALRVPKELRKTAAYVREVMEFSLWKERTRLKFYESWKAEALKEKYSWPDPAELCPEALRQVEEAGDRHAKYETARFAWSNCVNGAFRDRLGDAPAGDWEKFFSAHKVKVEFVGTEDCD